MSRLRRRLTVLTTAAAALALLSGCGSRSEAGYGGLSGQLAAVQRQAAANPDVDPGSSLPATPAPNFTLTDQFGAKVSLSSLRGRVVVLAFVDSKCTTVCPLTTNSMLDAVSLLGSAGRKVALVGIDANPDATSVADVAAYSKAHAMTHRWQFLTGTPRALAAVWRAYHVYVAAVHGNIDHEAALYVIDPSGHERDVYITQMAYGSIAQQGQVIADGIALVLPGGAKASQVTGLSYQPPVRPAARVTLRRIDAPGSVILGPGSPHVLVFFASWLSETQPIRAQLVALNSYARAARAHGWPSLVAVDVGDTEPTPGSAAAFVHSLPGRLDYPVVDDASGRVADGYGVQGLPWDVLVSASGHIRAYDNGWFTPAELDSAVAKAGLR